MKLSSCLVMLAWLYDSAHDQSFLFQVEKAKDGYELLGERGVINVRKVKHIGPSARYAVTLEYAGRLVIQCSGADLAGLAKGMMRSVAENMSEQVMSIFAEDAT